MNVLDDECLINVYLSVCLFVRLSVCCRIVVLGANVLQDNRLHGLQLENTFAPFKIPQLQTTLTLSGIS